MEGFSTIKELLMRATEKKVPVHDIVLDWEVFTSRKSKRDLWEEMRTYWRIMQKSIATGIKRSEKSRSGLTGGDAKKILAGKKNTYAGEAVMEVAAYAIAVNEVNAAMGKIVACPTAGSSGIVPAVLYLAKERYQQSEDSIVGALFTAAGFAMVIEENASIAGATGGCQAECGTATGMAAAALVELAGGTPEEIGEAAALAIKNLLGLACDPVAGLVEVPCVKRNGFCSVHALLAADLALAGIKSVIPVDEVIDAMDRIGRNMPHCVRETAEGGLATTETGIKLAKKIYGENG